MSNIYRVLNEEDLAELIEKNKFRVTVVIYTSKLNDIGKKIKKFLVELAYSYKESIFIYIDVDNFNTRNTINITRLPTSFIYFNRQAFYEIIGYDIEKIKSCFIEIEMRGRPITQNFLSKQQSTTNINPQEQIKVNYPLHQALFNQQQIPQQQMQPQQMPQQQMPQQQMPQQQMPPQQMQPQQQMQQQQMQQQQMQPQQMPQQMQPQQMPQQMQPQQQMQQQQMPQQQRRHVPSIKQTKINNEKESIENIINKLEKIKKTKQTET
jgi:DNA polymerase III gamma/tau subunit